MNLTLDKIATATLLTSLFLGITLSAYGWQMEPASNMEMYAKVFSPNWTDGQFSALRQLYLINLPQFVSQKISFLMTGVALCATSILLAIFALLFRAPIETKKWFLYLLLSTGVFVPQMSWSINDVIHNLFANPCVKVANRFSCEFAVYHSTEILPAEFLRFVLLAVCVVTAVALGFILHKLDDSTLGFSRLGDIIGCALLAIAVCAFITFGIDQRYSAMGFTITFFVWFLFWQLSFKGDAKMRGKSAD